MNGVIEVKGYWWGNDKEKMVLIEKEKYELLLSKSNKEDFLMVLWQ